MHDFSNEKLKKIYPDLKFISHFMRNTAELKLNENVISYMRKLPHANYKTIGELKREVNLLEIPDVISIFVD